MLENETIIYLKNQAKKSQIDPKRIAWTPKSIRVPQFHLKFLPFLLNLNPAFSAPGLLSFHHIHPANPQCWAKVLIWHLKVAEGPFSCRLAPWLMGFPYSSVLSWMLENALLSLILFLLSPWFLLVAVPSHPPRALSWEQLFLEALSSFSFLDLTLPRFSAYLLTSHHLPSWAIFLICPLNCSAPCVHSSSPVVNHRQDFKDSLFSDNAIPILPAQTSLLSSRILFSTLRWTLLPGHSTVITDSAC